MREWWRRQGVREAGRDGAQGVKKETVNGEWKQQNDGESIKATTHC